MTGFLVLLGLLAIVGIVATVRELGIDRPAEIPRSRFADPDLQPPARRRSSV
jgi:hypothetical protein